MKLYINQPPKEINEQKLTAVAEKILSDFDKTNKDIEITYVGNEAIRQMNVQYLGKDDFTDVIAFNLEDALEDNLLGDIYISAEQAKIQAGDFGSDYIHELVRVTIHGILHLLGYEDDTKEKKQKMHIEENKWLKEYFD